MIQLVDESPWFRRRNKYYARSRWPSASILSLHVNSELPIFTYSLWLH